MGNKIRWGVLSTANIGLKKVIPGMQRCEHATVDAIASRDLAKAREDHDDAAEQRGRYAVAGPRERSDRDRRSDDQQSDLENPVAIPEGVSIELSGQRLTAKGRLGTLCLVVNNEVSATVADGNVTVAPKDESKRARALWGTTRALVNNMVTGVATGFTRNLEINGVGYRASVQGNALNLQLGYSHDIAYPIPPDVQIACERPTVIAVTGADRQRVGQVAAEIRAFRPPEPYKGKGIKYSDETVRRKEGKKK